MNTNLAPQPKVVAGGIAGSVTAVLLWVLSEYGGVVLPPEVAAAVTTIIGFAASYLTSNK